jgi:RNA recognition motif-containing protein
MNIFVAKLNFRTESEELKTAFEQYGEVSSAKVIMDRETGKSKGFGFVEMPNDDEANNAINGLNEQELGGRVIVVKKAQPKEGSASGNRERSFNRY